MTKQNLAPPKESTISRQARNAFATTVIFIVAAMINLVVSLQISLSTQDPVSIADTIVVFFFLISSIISANLIRSGEKEKGIWLLISSFAITLAIRNALTADLGIIFGVLSVSLIPLIGLLTLKPNSFNRTLTLGVLSSSFYLVFDILASNYLPPYRQLSENVETMVRTITTLAIIITFLYIITLLRQHRFLLLSSKITLVMVFFVLIPIISLSVIGAISLKNSLVPRQNEKMRLKASFLANSVETFIQSNKSAIRADSQTPVFAEYLSSLGETQNMTLSQIRKEALESLRSIKRKDISLINSYAILDISGKNVLDTSLSNFGNDESEENYFIQAKETGDSFVSDAIRDTLDNRFFYFSAPIYHPTTGDLIGVLRSEYKISALQKHIDSYIEIEGDNKNIFAALITEKETKVIDPEDPSSVYLILVNSKSEDLNLKSITPLTTNVITPLQMAHIMPVGSTAQLSLDVPGFNEGLNERSKFPIFEAQAFPRNSETEIPLDVIAVKEIEEELLSWIIIVSQDLETFNMPFQQQNNTNMLLAVFIAIIAAILAYFGSQYLIRPLTSLANAANKVAEGNFEARVIINSEDEIGTLGNAFNSMANQLHTFITTLEDQIKERTQALERNTHHLRAAVEVGKSAANLRNLEELLSQATELISKEFGFYHAGIFLVDTYGKYALLKAANSKGGRRMLAREHKLEVGEEGIVGFVTATGEARIALDVGRDAIFFNNPLLPDTRSEMALPLIAGNKIFGALDIQSTKSKAFSEADITSLQVLADQIAIAIENARLFEESQKALATAQRAYGEQSQIGWQELLHQSQKFGYRGSSDGNIYPLDENINKALEQTMQENQVLLDENNMTANIPITMRGEAIGAIQLSKADYARAWQKKDLDLAKTLTTELSRAMDSARLFDETRQQADRERVIGEISNKMRETMNVESVIRLATDELYKLLDLEQITIHLSSDESDEEEIT